MRVRFMIAKLVASTADNLCRSARRKVFPRSLQIAQVADKNLEGVQPVYRLFPRQRHIPSGVAVEKRECLDDDRNRGVQPGAGSEQQFPLLPRPRMQRVARQRQSDPRAAVDEDRLALPHHGSS